MKHSFCWGCMEPIEQDICPNCGFSESSPEAHQLIPGTMLKDRYVVGKVIGEGGFGITYIGRDTVLDLKVAIKEFYMPGYVNRNCTSSTKVQAVSGSNGETFNKNREKFLTEARVLAKFVKEDGIVGIRDFFEENNTAYIVMDYLSGETLRSRIDRVGKLPADEAIDLLRPVFASLMNIHQYDIIHRDISPDNIMVTEDGKVKLLDFGAARQVSTTDIKSVSVILKPGYSPEEQYRSKGKQGPWTDVYALCATLYRCITGIVPDDAMERMFDDKLVPPAELGCPPAVSAVIMKGLSLRQPDRYQSLQEFCTALDEATGGMTVVPTAAPQNKEPAEPVEEPKTVPMEPLDEPKKKRRIWPALLGIGVVVAAILAAVFLLLPQNIKPSVTYNGTAIQVPTTFAELEKAGWTTADWVLESEVNAGQTGMISIGNQNNTIWVRYCNPGESAIKTADCTVYEIDFHTGNINTNQNTVEVEGLILGKTTREEFSAEDWEQQQYGAYVRTCGKTGSYSLEFNATGKLSIITIRNTVDTVPDNDKTVQESTESENPEQISKEESTQECSGEIPTLFSDFEVLLNGESYTIPTTFSELENRGWICDDQDFINQGLGAGIFDPFGVFLTNGSNQLKIYFQNSTDNTLLMRECSVNQIDFSAEYLSDAIETPGGFIVGKTTLSEFKASAPSGYGINEFSGYDTACYYRSSVNGKVVQYYGFIFDQNTEVLKSISIKNLAV